MSSNTDDLKAIDTFFASQHPKTITGKNILTQWQQWYPSVTSFWSWKWSTATDADLTEGKRLRDQYNLAESPRAFTALQKSPQATEEENQWFKDMPIVNTTGMSPSDAKSAIWDAKNTREPPESLKKLGFTGTSSDTNFAGAHKTVQQGSRNADVGVWQQLVGANVTNNFDANTRKLTIDWQIAHGLKGDGIVGSKTWTMALNLANPNGTALPSFDERANSVSGNNTVPYAVAAAPSHAKAQVASVGWGHATGAQANKYLKELTLAKERQKSLAVSALPTTLPKIAPWAWAGMAAAAVAGVLYAVFGKPKTVIYKDQ